MADYEKNPATNKDPEDLNTSEMRQATRGKGTLYAVIGGTALIVVLYLGLFSGEIRAYSIANNAVRRRISATDSNAINLLNASSAPAFCGRARVQQSANLAYNS